MKPKEYLNELKKRVIATSGSDEWKGLKLNGKALIKCGTYSEIKIVHGETQTVRLCENIIVSMHVSGGRNLRKWRRILTK